MTWFWFIMLLGGLGIITLVVFEFPVLLWAAIGKVLWILGMVFIALVGLILIEEADIS